MNTKTESRTFSPKKRQYHAAYGLDTSTRIKAVRDAKSLGVAKAAIVNKVDVPSIYRWKSHYKELV